MMKITIPNKTVIAMAGIVILEIVALSLGYNAHGLEMAMLLLGGLGGYTLGKTLHK